MTGPSALGKDRSFLFVMHYQKPYLPLQQQIARLQARGMLVPDLHAAEKALNHIGYYRLSAYWYVMREIQNGAPVDDFKQGAEFETVAALYQFDKKLRLLLLEALESIEIALRVQLVQQLGTVSPWAHRDPAALDGRFAARHHTHWLQRLNECERRSKDDFVQHFQRKYTSTTHLPIWISVEVWEFGLLSKFIEGLKYADGMALASIYQLNHIRTLPSWTKSLNLIRNICAHHGRLWNRSIDIKPTFRGTDQNGPFAHIVNNRHSQERLYSLLVVMGFMLRCYDPATTWVNRLKAHLTTFPCSNLTSLNSAGFPTGWQSEAFWS